MARRSSQALRNLYAVATRQGSYFTAKQAAAMGYSKQHLDYHRRFGNFERIERGLYRLPTLPFSPHDDLIRWSLWSRGRDDRPQAVVSHETALAFYELSDLIPAKIHLSVPPGFRKTPPPVCILHKAVLTPQEEELGEGFRVTTPLRTLVDVAAAPVPQEQVERAIEEALERGLVRRSQLVEALRSHPFTRRQILSAPALRRAVG
ncbi:MAG TPA: type IV toxin-antitoxin system AbiEi family antitoxin domain-containing protein [Thermoanaerobaculia bacterium]|nr:type IV toxin-antitoxin system AbiEi family antitoxin domain-containing protein [Thermoanaerobaculia bacterium]